MSDKMQNSGGEGSSEKKGIFAVGGGKTDGVVKIRRRSLPVVICVCTHCSPHRARCIITATGNFCAGAAGSGGVHFSKKNPPLFPFYFVRGIDNLSSAAGRKRGNEMAT